MLLQFEESLIIILARKKLSRTLRIQVMIVGTNQLQILQSILRIKTRNASIGCKKEAFVTIHRNDNYLPS